MDAPVTHDLFEFEEFCLDRRSGGLFRRDAAGGLTPVPIGSRALDVLGVLVSRPGELLSKQAIMQTVWPRIVVDEKNLAVQVATLRRVLDSGRTDRSCIQTEAGRGYRFVAPVTRVSGDDRIDARTVSPTAGSPVSVAAARAAGAAAVIPRPVLTPAGRRHLVPYPCWWWSSGLVGHGWQRNERSRSSM